MQRRTRTFNRGDAVMNWIIVCVKDANLCWSNSWGWCSETYDTFTQEERETLDLPIDGQWWAVSWSIA